MEPISREEDPMARVNDLRDRFRPAGAPGAGTDGPGPLTDVRQRCTELGEAARVEARELTARADREAAELIRRAEADVEAVRAEAAARLRATAEEELAQLVTRAQDEARAIREHAARRLPALAELVVAHVRVELSALVGDENVPAPAIPR